MSAEWEELKVKLDSPEGLSLPYRGKVIDWMAEIEHRYLPERIAEILEKASTKQMLGVSDIRLGASIPRYMRNQIAKALCTGDLSEIEKWVKE